MPTVDPGLFRRAIQGDRDAFWQLVLPFRGLIYSVAFGSLRNHERAEDELHDVLLIAFRSLSSLRDPAKLPNWLYSITRNHVLDTQRREQRLHKALETAAREPALVVPLSDSAEREEALVRMEEALRHLPEPFRVILGLKYMNDYSCREIADILGLPDTTVKSRLFEARKLLRKKTLALASDDKEHNHGVQ